MDIEDRKSLQKAQKTWHDEDAYKHFDFSRFEFWITTDDGEVGQGFDTMEEALAYMKESR